MTTQREFWTPGAYGNPELRASDEPLTRAHDPPSSHLAAKKALVKVSSCNGIILSILRRSGKRLTYREIHALATPVERGKLREPSTVAERLTVLERRGFVQAGTERMCTVGKNLAREWSVVAPLPGN